MAGLYREEHGRESQAEGVFGGIGVLDRADGPEKRSLPEAIDLLSSGSQARKKTARKLGFVA
jgi:hypothetical protein